MGQKSIKMVILGGYHKNPKKGQKRAKKRVFGGPLPLYLTSRKVAFSNRSRAVNTGTPQRSLLWPKMPKMGFPGVPPVPPKPGFWVPPPKSIKIDKNRVFWGIRNYR